MTTASRHWKHTIKHACVCKTEGVQRKAPSKHTRSCTRSTCLTLYPVFALVSINRTFISFALCSPSSVVICLWWAQSHRQHANNHQDRQKRRTYRHTHQRHQHGDRGEKKNTKTQTDYAVKVWRSRAPSCCCCHRGSRPKVSTLTATLFGAFPTHSRERENIQNLSIIARYST